MTTAPRAAARTSFVSLTVVLATVATSTSALAVGGRPDPSFSDDGRATAFRNGGAAYAVAIDRRGRILVAGYDVGRRDTDLALARFRSNGRLDRRFGGGDGRVTTDLGGTDYGFDVAVGSRGRIVVAGMRERRRGSRMAVAVYGPRGRLDRSFSRNGIAFIGFGRAFQGATSVAIGASGRIVAG